MGQLDRTIEIELRGMDGAELEAWAANMVPWILELHEVLRTKKRLRERLLNSTDENGASLSLEIVESVETITKPLLYGFLGASSPDHPQHNAGILERIPSIDEPRSTPPTRNP